MLIYLLVLTIEFEDIVDRKNYILKINWDCTKCGNHSELVGCVLSGEKLYEDRESPVTWEDILHKKCKKCGFTERPNRICSKCNSEYEFGQMGCDTCNKEIKVVIELQNNLFTIREQIRKDKRVKNDTSTLEQAFRDLIKLLEDMGYHSCPVCHDEFTTDGICFQCIRDGEQEL